MKRYLMAASVAALCTGGGVQAQTNGLDPANLPPAGFDGREFVDSAGCAFLRSTFGGEVTWVPRYGPDRTPVCDQTPTDFAAAASAPDAPAPDTAAQGDAETRAQADPAMADDTAMPETMTDTASADSTADTGVSGTMADGAGPATAADSGTATAVPRGRVEVVGPVNDSARRPDPAFLGKERQVDGLAPRGASPARAKPRHLVADASGRHPSCPARAPFGQLVDTMQGRKMVRCVTSPSLFLDDYDVSPVRAASSKPRAVAGHGARVQVGSFGVPGNAHRLVAKLSARGLPAGSHSARGLLVVTIGPFASGSAAQNALAQVRAMGFGDAFLRR